MADKTTVNDVIERRDASRKWMRDNIYSELVEVNRAIKCRTVPILKKNRAGQETTEVDKSRTNVCMPDLNIIHRRNVARMTAQPYRLNYIGGKDPMIADFLSALAAQQYDRSGEQWHDRRVTMMGEAFGFGYSKLYYDQLSRTMIFRRALMKGNDVIYRDRASIMRAAGAPQDEIDGAVAELGPEMSDAEIAQAMGKTGTEIKVPTDITKYEGPCLKSVFIGDLFLEPGCLNLDSSDFVIEQYRESDIWLKRQMDTLTYEDENGQEVKAFDEKAVKDLLDTAGDDGTSPSKTSENDLKQMFESAVGKQTETQIMFPGRLRPRKKYDIIEQHELGEDGRIWITWVSEKMKDKPLGKMPQQFDLYGKYLFTELVPLPDMVGPFGDSTPRLLRFLHQMHNLTVAQNFDYITNIMKKFLLVENGLNVNDETIDRGWFKELKVEKINGIQYLQEPPLPNGALQREAQILQSMGMAEPSLMNTTAGTETNPMAGKTATTAVLASKAADALTQFKLDGRNIYLKELGQKKLWINQQMASEKWEIEQKFWGGDLRKKIDAMDQEKAERPEWALSDRNGKTVAIRLDPMEIQEDYQVEPEPGSYLSVDDELNQQKAMQLQQVATVNPGIIDQRKVARFQLTTIHGIGNPDDYIVPEPEGPQPPPLKGNISVNIPLDKMPADVVNQILPMVGLQPSEELEHRDTIDGVAKISDAANKMGQAAQPVVEPPEEVAASANG